MVIVCGLRSMQMEISMGVSPNYLQGNAEVLEPIEDEEYQLPAEDRKVVKLRSIKVGRGKA